jgi:UDP-N-acetylmuramyl tripeptide synthase
MKFTLTLWLCKIIRLVMRVFGRNATYLPGKIALALYPRFLEQVGKPKMIIAVTGTNGKTTVCNLLCDILESRGMKPLSNRLGSNIDAGIATSLLQGAALNGGTRYATAVFEIDERSAGKIFPYVKPNLLIVTNLFRDSIMRNAHPEYIADFLGANIPRDTRLVLNGDDLISCGIAPKNRRVYFGIEKLPTDVTQCVNLINDMRLCPRCSGELVYDRVRYHHIGRAHCPDCEFMSPKYNYAAKNVDIANMSMSVSDKKGLGTYKLISDSVFNIYNMVAVIAALRELGLSSEEISDGFQKTGIPASRHNTETAGDLNIVMQMSKDRNALACSRVFDYIGSLPGKKELILMMNNLGDSRHWSENVCWLYDCDFEFLNNVDITRIVTTGPRARDYYLRLQYAGIPESKILCTDDEISAPAQLEYNAGESVFILYGTDAVELAYRVRNGARDLASGFAEQRREAMLASLESQTISADYGKYDRDEGDHL